ncbi:MAG: Ig-like domain-containing protein, partial [Gemmatimonadota bacterium]|nr:Ig-like domain-containing protein [Gemmatimonadota bacterium]
MGLRALYIPAGFILILVSCARMGPPPGGPEDKEPPAVASVTPAPDSTSVALDAVIEVLFTEKVKKDQAERLVSLTPAAGRFFFKWDGAALRARPEGALRPDITYRLTVEPGLVDLHRVKSDKRFVSFFSTGSHFSPGRIEGHVAFQDSMAAGARLSAVSIEDTTLAFAAESDSSGSYVFPYLPFGKYRLSAYRDRNNNKKFDFTREAGADSVADLIFDPLKINFQLVVADTTPPFLGSVLCPDSVTVALAFDDMLDSLRGISGAYFELRSPDSLGQTLAVDSVFIDSTDRRRVILRLERPLVPETTYFVTS